MSNGKFELKTAQTEAIEKAVRDAIQGSRPYWNSVDDSVNDAVSKIVKIVNSDDTTTLTIGASSDFPAVEWDTLSEDEAIRTRPTEPCVKHPSLIWNWNGRTWFCPACFLGFRGESPDKNDCSIHPSRKLVWNDESGYHAWECEGCVNDDPAEDGRPFVDKYYEMDPTTEELLFDGSLLKNGMEVLIETREERQDIRPVGMSDIMIDRAKERNRWAVISNLTFEGINYSFIAEYPDETRRKRAHHKSHAWLVKKSSIEAIDWMEASYDDKFDQVEESVKETLTIANGLRDEDAVLIANTLTKKIFEEILRKSDVIGDETEKIADWEKKPAVLDLVVSAMRHINPSVGDWEKTAADQYAEKTARKIVELF